MSWQGYVDNQLLGTGSVSQAAIYGLNGGKWAASAGFEVRPCFFFPSRDEVFYFIFFTLVARFRS